MIRLQKYIANSGITSRRKAEKMIVEGVVSVNGTVITKLGTSIDPDSDTVKVDGKNISPKSNRTFVYALYKPKNCVTTLEDPQGRDTIVTYFPKTQLRLFPIGRLDYDAEGLVLLTNDGDLANQISHPRHHVWKQYFVKVKGKIQTENIIPLIPGPIIDGIKRQPVRIKFLHHVNDKSWLLVSLQEGVKHHLKKMFKGIGFPVLKIKRYSVGNIELEEMKPGESRQLANNEIDELINLATK